MHKKNQGKKDKGSSTRDGKFTNSLCSGSQAITSLAKCNRIRELYRLVYYIPLVFGDGPTIFYLRNIQSLKYEETFAIWCLNQDIFRTMLYEEELTVAGFPGFTPRKPTRSNTLGTIRSRTLLFDCDGTSDWGSPSHKQEQDFGHMETLNKKQWTT